MAITQYVENGNTYNFQDFRFPEISSADANKIFKIDDGGNIIKAENQASKATGNLSLEKTSHTLSTETLDGNYIQWNDIVRWKQKNIVVAGQYVPSPPAPTAVSIGGPLVSEDGFNYYYAGRSSSGITGPGLFSIAVSSKAIASDFGTAIKIYYTKDGNAWSTAKSGSEDFTFNVSPANYLDLCAGGGKYLAIPHGISTMSYAYSYDGINWITDSLDYTADTQFIYHNNAFWYLHLTNTNKIEYYRFTNIGAGNTPDWEKVGEIITTGVPTSVKVINVENILYMIYTSASGNYCCNGPDFDSIIVKSDWSPSFSANSIKKMFVGDKTLYCWNGDHNLYKLFTLDSTSTWETETIVNSSYTPSNVCYLSNVIYASTTNSSLNVYTSADGGKTWTQGIYEYLLSQVSEKEDDTDTTKIVMNLLKRDDGTYEIGADDVGAIAQPTDVSDGQIIQYNSTTNTWQAVDMPAAHSYKATFTNNWGSAVSGWYTIEYVQATHGCGTANYNYQDLSIDIYATDGTSYTKINGYPSTVAYTVSISNDSSTYGKVSLKATTPFAGMIVIK